MFFHVSSTFRNLNSAFLACLIGLLPFWLRTVLGSCVFSLLDFVFYSFVEERPIKTHDTGDSFRDFYTWPPAAN